PDSLGPYVCFGVMLISDPLLVIVIRRPPISPLFPYTTLFRSAQWPEPRRRRAAYRYHNLVRLGATRHPVGAVVLDADGYHGRGGDRKSTRLNSSHVKNSYAVFCLKKKNLRGEHSTLPDNCPRL